MFYVLPSNERLAAVRQMDDVTGLDVRSRVLEESEVVAGVVVEAVGRQVTRHPGDEVVTSWLEL